jgi:dihydroorotate dehydrogenase (NAD+) catalytic subunit
MDCKIEEAKFNTNRLSVSIFKNTFTSPLIVASGTLIEKYNEINLYLSAGAGAVAPRTTRLVMERKSHPTPHLYHTGSRKFPIMLNAEWTGADIEYWRPYLQQMSTNLKTIMSVSGRDIAGCVKVCKELDQFSGWPYLEINVSCAHSNNVHGMITRNEEHIRSLVSALKDADIQTPFAIKLGYSDQIVFLANVAKEAGADAIVAINTFGPVFDFDLDDAGTPQPVVGISSGKGGLSGAPLFNIALTAIGEIKRQVKIPVIGSGGVVNAEHVLKMMMAGADAVQVYSAAHVRGINAPAYFTETNRALLKLLDKYKINSVSDVVGKALYILEQETHMSVKVPVLNQSQCIGCDLCIDICLPKAISYSDSITTNKFGHVVKINDETCIGCGHCVPVCPTTPRALNYSELVY